MEDFIMEQIQEITIVKAFSELKLLNKKIERAISSSKFVASKVRGKHIDEKYTDEEFDKNSKSSWTSINDLISRYKKIKSAIAISNALTKVKVDNVEMTVTEAIEYKKHILFDKRLLDRMKNQLSNNLDLVETNNSYVKDRLDNFMNSSNMDKIVGTIKPENYKTFKSIYEKSNEWILKDPLNIEEKIKELENRIDNFESEIDHVLAESNTITKLQIV